MTSDGGLILVRELDERLGLEQLIAEHWRDSRQGLNKQFMLADLLRQSVYSRLAGYEDLNHAERLAADPTFRLIKHARYYWLMLAGGHLHRRLFGQMLRRIWALPVPTGEHTDCGCKVWGTLGRGGR